MGRVCGTLAVSRALGDFFFKDREDLADHEQKITAAPDVIPVKRHVRERSDLKRIREGKKHLFIAL